MKTPATFRELARCQGWITRGRIRANFGYRCREKIRESKVLNLNSGNPRTPRKYKPDTANSPDHAMFTEHSFAKRLADTGAYASIHTTRYPAITLSGAYLPTCTNGSSNRVRIITSVRPVSGHGPVSRAISMNMTKLCRHA